MDAVLLFPSTKYFQVFLFSIPHCYSFALYSSCPFISGWSGTFHSLLFRCHLKTWTGSDQGLCLHHPWLCYLSNSSVLVSQGLTRLQEGSWFPPCPAKCPGSAQPPLSCSLLGWALASLHCCSLLGVDLLKMEQAKLPGVFFQGLGAVPYLLHPESCSWQVWCCRAQLPREKGVTWLALGSDSLKGQVWACAAPFLFKTCRRALRSASRGSDRSCFSDFF